MDRPARQLERQFESGRKCHRVPGQILPILLAPLVSGLIWRLGSLVGPRTACSPSTAIMSPIEEELRGGRLLAIQQFAGDEQVQQRKRQIQVTP